MPVELVATLAIYIVLWQSYQIRKRLPRFGRVALLAVVISAVANPALQRMIDAGWFGEVDPGLQRFYGAIIVILGSTIGLYLFRLAADGYGLRSPRVIRFVGLSLILLAAWIALVVVATARGQSMLYGPGAFAHLPGLIYFATTGPYLFMVRLLVIIWIIRRTREDDTSIVLRWGARLAGLGLLVAGLVALVRAIPPIMILLGAPVFAAPPWLLHVASTVGSPLIIGGLSLPLLVGRFYELRSWFGHRRSYARVEPLWKVSIAAYPEIELRDPRAPLGYRLRRRRTECLDALHNLRTAQTNDTCAPARLAAVERLHGAVDQFERTSLAGDELWSFIDRQRNSPPDKSSPLGNDHDLLEQLADLLKK